MNETIVTLQGWLGSDVTVRQAGDDARSPASGWPAPRGATSRRPTSGSTATPSGTPSTPGAASPRTATQSLHRGRPGRRARPAQRPDLDNNAGLEVTSFEVEAVVVGHDLNRGTSTFNRPPRLLEPGAEDPEPTAGDGDDEPVGAVPAA